MTKKTRKLNIANIEATEWYNLPEIALMLWVAHSTLTRKCHSDDLLASNIWTHKKAIFRVLWKDLLQYLAKTYKLKNVKVWDKIVYDWATTKHYVLVGSIGAMRFEDKSIHIMINNKFMKAAPFRKPTQKELDNQEFKS